MNGIPVLRILRDQFYSEAPVEIERPGLRRLQFLWLAMAILVGGASFFLGPVQNGMSSVLAANAIFTALSVTMAMFFWPRAVNLKSDADLMSSPLRWYIYRLTTQLFWTVVVGIVATGLALIHLAGSGRSLCGCGLGHALLAVCIGLTVYQVLLIAESAFVLYGATYWLPKA